jgi:AAA+ ATPase superfamily predicted ATPase
MKFYDRETEMKLLQTLHKQSGESGRMTVLTGRRRVGKTLLALEFAKTHKFIYLFVAKKSESLLCTEYIEEIKQVFDIPVIGEIRRFKDVFSLLLEISREQHFTLIIDEFQEFYHINPAVYSEIQDLWDRNKDRCKLNLIFIGSYKTFKNKNPSRNLDRLWSRRFRNAFSPVSFHRRGAQVYRHTGKEFSLYL